MTIEKDKIRIEKVANWLLQNSDYYMELALEEAEDMLIEDVNMFYEILSYTPKTIEEL